MSDTAFPLLPSVMGTLLSGFTNTWRKRPDDHSFQVAHKSGNKKAGDFRPYWMVEAAGIEPASANPLPLVLHA